MYLPCEKGLVAGAWSCFKVYYVGRCQLLYKLHVLEEGLCVCVHTRTWRCGSINNIFPTDVLTLTNLFLAHVILLDVWDDGPR